MGKSKGGALTLELNLQSKKNADIQFDKLKKLGLEEMKKGLVKILFDIKALAQLKLKADEHIVTSRLRNSIYVKVPEWAKNKDNAKYSDITGKNYNADFEVDLAKNEGAVGTNVDYAEKIETQYDSFLYWGLKNVDLDKRWREVSKELLGITK